MGMSMSYVQVIAAISNEQYALGDDVTSRVGSRYPASHASCLGLSGLSTGYASSSIPRSDASDSR